MKNLINCFWLGIRLKAKYFKAGLKKNEIRDLNYIIFCIKRMNN